MRIVVTGATGLIGRRLVPLICASGHEVHTIGRNAPRDQRAFFHKLDLIAGGDRLPDLLTEIGATHAVHLAWYAEPGKFWSAPENLDWLAASLKFTRAFTAAGGYRLIVAGTCAEYDWSGNGVLDEIVTPLAPASPYGSAKLTLFRLLTTFASALGLSLGWARIFFPYAADERPERLLGTLIAAARNGVPARFTAGMQARDFISTAEVAAAIACFLTSQAQGAVNIGTGSAVRVRDFVSQAASLLERPIQLDFETLPLRPDQPILLVASTERLRKDVGYTPPGNIIDGLINTLREAGLTS